jgi:hypothetical protein
VLALQCSRSLRSLESKRLRAKVTEIKVQSSNHLMRREMLSRPRSGAEGPGFFVPSLIIATKVGANYHLSENFFEKSFVAVWMVSFRYRGRRYSK